MIISGAIIRDKFISENTPDKFNAIYKGREINITTDHGHGKPKYDHLKRYDITVIHLESGMYDVISKICLPGQYILDPFCGASTTGVAALRFGCLFDGLEIDQENVNISRGRMNDQTA